MPTRPFSAIANARHTLAAPVANAGTFTVAYPAGTSQSTLTGSTDGQIALRSGESFRQAASGAGTVAFAFGASNITVTNNTGNALPAGEITLSFGAVDITGDYNLTTPRRVQNAANAGSWT